MTMFYMTGVRRCDMPSVEQASPRTKEQVANEGGQERSRTCS